MKIIADFVTNSSEADYYDCADDCDCDCNCDCDCADACSLHDYIADAFGGEYWLYEDNFDCRD